MKYLVIFERTATGFSVFSPDLPGCVSSGSTRDEAEANMREAIEFHLDGLRTEGETLPKPSTDSTYLEVSLV